MRGTCNGVLAILTLLMGDKCTNRTVLQQWYFEMAKNVHNVFNLYAHGLWIRRIFISTLLQNTGFGILTQIPEARH